MNKKSKIFTIHCSIQQTMAQVTSKSSSKNRCSDDDNFERRKNKQSFTGADAVALPKQFSRKYVALLNALCHANNNQRVALIRTADTDLIKCICECALNVLRGNVKVESSRMKQLKKHKKVLRKLIEKPKKYSRSRLWNNKKRTIIQSGGSFLPVLLQPLLSTIFSAILSSSIGKR